MRADHAAAGRRTGFPRDEVLGKTGSPTLWRPVDCRCRRRHDPEEPRWHRCGRRRLGLLLLALRRPVAATVALAAAMASPASYTRAKPLRFRRHSGCRAPPRPVVVDEARFVSPWRRWARDESGGGSAPPRRVCSGAGRKGPRQGPAKKDAAEERRLERPAARETPAL